jgi:hypothetical protein
MKANINWKKGKLKWLLIKEVRALDKGIIIESIRKQERRMKTVVRDY